MTPIPKNPVAGLWLVVATLIVGGAYRLVIWFTSGGGAAALSIGLISLTIRIGLACWMVAQRK